MTTNSSKRRGGLFPRTLAACAAPVLKPIFKKHGLAEARVVTDWALIVGDKFATRCLPLKITYPKGKQDNGTLHVRAKAGFATELPYMEPVILEKLATYFGYKAVARLAIEQAYF